MFLLKSSGWYKERSMEWILLLNEMKALNNLNQKMQYFKQQITQGCKVLGSDVGNL